MSFRCGYVALLGRPNVGKSTLLNRLLGQKLSITSHRPQTTRHRIIGVKTDADSQILYVDTPGLHRRQERAINRYMNRAADSIIRDVDVIVLMVDALHWGEEDDWVLDRLRDVTTPVILVVNKMDRLKDKTRLLAYLSSMAEKYSFAQMIPLSARSGKNTDRLEAEIRKLLPEAPPVYPNDQLTDRSARFLAAELVREKLFRRLGQELPYGLTVEVEQFREQGDLTDVHVLIWVESGNQKAIVIGKGGALLKAVGSAARHDMESLFGGKVNLKLWVKVKEGWADDERALHSLGYNDQ